MKKPFHIVTLCDAPSLAPRTSVDGNAKNVRIIVEYDDGSKEIIFERLDFDEARHAEQVARVEGFRQLGVPEKVTLEHEPWNGPKQK